MITYLILTIITLFINLILNGVLARQEKGEIYNSKVFYLLALITITSFIPFINNIVMVYVMQNIHKYRIDYEENNI